MGVNTFLKSAKQDRAKSKKNYELITEYTSRSNIANYMWLLPHLDVDMPKK